MSRTRDTDLEHEVEHLRRAVEHRDVIGQAKGLLMASCGVSAAGAFEILRQVSQRTNVKLHTVAADLVATHTQRLQDGRRQRHIDAAHAPTHRPAPERNGQLLGRDDDQASAIDLT